MVGMYQPVMESIDRKSVVPLYYQLAELLREQLRSGELRSGDQMPSERDLIQRYCLSRNTVRQALDILANEGLVVRSHGHGTFVSGLGEHFSYMLDTFFENRDLLQRAGYVSEVRQVSAEWVIPPDFVRMALSLEPEEETVRFTLVFYADDRPAMYTQDFLPSGIADQYDLPGGKEGFLEYLDRSTGRQVEYILVDIAPIAADGDIARTLDCLPGTPILLFKETFLDSTQKNPIAYSLNYFNQQLVDFRLLARRGR